MKQEATLIRARLKTPRAAAIAGILFSVLLITGPLTVPAFGPGRSAGDGGRGLRPVRTTGIAFLWFIGVLRDRLGEFEDRFFATVFLGSGLLFLAMLFASAAVAGGIIIA